MSDAQAFQSIFRAANARLVDLDLAWCREAELRAVRALRFSGPRPAMVRQLLKNLEDAPLDEALRERVHWTLRRLYRALQGKGVSAEIYRVAANAYLDGQVELAARWLDMDTLFRPWGER